MEKEETKGVKEVKKSVFSVISLLLGILALCLSFIPIVNNASFFLGLLAVIFGLIPIFKKAKKGMAIAGIVLGVLSIVITLSLQSSWSKSLDEVSKDLDNATGDNTEEVLKNVDVVMGDFQVEADEYFTNTKMVVKVTNKLDKKKSYSIHVEATDASGNRIAEDYISANDLGPNQTQEFEIFNFVEDSKVEAMKSATFKIVDASMF